MRSAWLRTARELGLRLGSSVTSLLLILALARAVPIENFVASQLAMLVIGLAAVASDAGLVLYTTRAVASGRTKSIPRIASLRLLLAAASLILGSLLVGNSDGSAGAYVLLLGPYLVSQVVRNHVYAQVRAVDGVRFELTTAPLVNAAESLIAAGVVTATASVGACYSSLSLSALPLTALVVVLASRRYQTAIQVGRPSLRLLAAAGRSGLVPLAAGAALKTFGIVLGSGTVSSALGTATTAWLLACIRSLDAANLYLTTRIIVADHARASRGWATSTTQGLWFVGAAYLLCVSALPLALLGSTPPDTAWLLGLVVSALAFLWFVLSRIIHIGHGYRGRSPWWVLFGVHAQIAVPVAAGVLGETGVAVLAFVVPTVAAGITLVLVTATRVASQP